MNCRKRIISFAFVVSLLFPAVASAQQVTVGRFGQKYFTLGGAFEHGLVFNGPNAPESIGGASPSSGMRFRMGMHHTLTTEFLMSAEGGVGYQWLDEHTVSVSGNSDSEGALAFQVALLGRWVPSGDLSGLHVGAGLNWFQASLEEAPVQILGGDLRMGWFFWASDLEFVLLDIGYTIPAIAGLNLPTDFSGERGPVAMDWSWHRLSISMSVSF